MTSGSPTGRHAPGGFDTARDTAAGLPLELVAEWRRGGRHADGARRLLAPHAVRGYALVSDSAGLTELSERLTLLEVLALIDRPKRVLYGHTRAAGGRAVGVWAADNTQMFHPETTDPATLLAVLLTVQDEIGRCCRVRIGIGVHLGGFYDLAGGLYGPEAEAIEDLAENHTEGGEIVVTGAVADRLPPGHPFVLRRSDAAHPVLGPVHRVLDGPRADGLRPVDERYPIPYSAAFYDGLLGLDARPGDAALAARLAAEHLRERTVVLAERATPPDTGDPELALLRGFALSAVLRDTGLRLLPARGATEVKVAGPLAIYLFDDPLPAVRFARRLRADLAGYEIVCRIGVDTGPVLAGELPGGGRDVAGAPVNLASKMAQDAGLPGHIYLSQAVRARTGAAGFTPVRRALSGVLTTFYEG